MNENRCSWFQPQYVVVRETYDQCSWANHVYVFVTQPPESSICLIFANLDTSSCQPFVNRSGSQSVWRSGLFRKTLLIVPYSCSRTNSAVHRLRTRVKSAFICCNFSLGIAVRFAPKIAFFTRLTTDTKSASKIRSCRSSSASTVHNAKNNHTHTPEFTSK